MTTEKLIRRCEQLAKAAASDAGYWADLAYRLRTGHWPEEEQERWAIQHEDDPLPAWIRPLLRRDHE